MFCRQECSKKEVAVHLDTKVNSSRYFISIKQCMALSVTRSWVRPIPLIQHCGIFLSPSYKYNVPRPLYYTITIWYCKRDKLQH